MVGKAGVKQQSEREQKPYNADTQQWTHLRRLASPPREHLQIRNLNGRRVIAAVSTKQWALVQRQPHVRRPAEEYIVSVLLVVEVILEVGNLPRGTGL